MWDHTKAALPYRVVRVRDGADVGECDTYLNALALAVRRSNELHQVKETHVEYLKRIEHELARRLGHPDVIYSQRRKETLDLMLCMTRDAINGEHSG
jgi:hypothetical protein